MKGALTAMRRTLQAGNNADTERGKGYNHESKANIRKDNKLIERLARPYANHFDCKMNVNDKEGYTMAVGKS